VQPGEPLVLRQVPRYVGRGGLKLEGALDRFGIEVAGLRAVDAGASTGGFTDCLLQRGAERVWAVDVGRNQLHERLQADPRVTSMERTDIRAVDPESIGGSVPLLVGDLSFISLRTVAPALVRLVQPGGRMVLLVKPQFEATRAEASRGKGVVADPEVWRRSIRAVDGALEQAGASMMGLMCSPIRGSEGNVEFLLDARVAPGTPTQGLGEDAVDAAIAEAMRPSDPEPAS
jgi:23S rRNA (cytidine1920-2'-O)/16S rRNA (cytidine1409-2'-O)-methyltransferase